MATFEDLQKANAAISSMTISRYDKKTGKTVNKEYAEVNQRIKAFRMVYPMGSIITEMLSNEGGVCVFKASVYGGENVSTLLGVGHAYESEGSSNINQTSYIENCETSAVGRALGMAGFGIDTSVASYEEVQNAIINQEKSAAPLDKNKVDALNMLIDEVAADPVSICDYYGVDSIANMSETQWAGAMKILSRRKESKHAAGSGKQS